MTDQDVFTTATAGLKEVLNLVFCGFGMVTAWISTSVRSARACAVPTCGCSPTTALSPARPFMLSRGHRSPCIPATTATWRRRCTGTACGWRTVTTGSRTRPSCRSDRRQLQLPGAVSQRRLQLVSPARGCGVLAGRRPRAEPNPGRPARRGRADRTVPPVRAELHGDGPLRQRAAHQR